MPRDRDGQQHIKCTVCMATFNGERFLNEQIKSVLNDLGANDELVIVDDSSSDHTTQIVKKFKDKRIRFFYNLENIGILKTFEKALTISRGEIIFFCDQDDVWYKGKRDEMVKIVTKPGVMVAVCDANIIDERGRIISESFFKLRKSRPGLWNNLFRNSYIGCGMCLRRELLSILLPFPCYVSMHDEWTGLMGDIVGKVEFVKKPLFGYRRHSKNFSSMKWSGLKFALKKRILNLIAIARRLPKVL